MGGGELRQTIDLSGSIALSERTVITVRISPSPERATLPNVAQDEAGERIASLRSPGSTAPPQES